MKKAELVKKCQERMKSIRDKNYFTLRFGKTKMYSEKPFKKINMKQTAVEKAKELKLKFGKVLAPLVVDEVIKELNEEIYKDSYLHFWDSVKNELINETFKSE